VGRGRKWRQNYRLLNQEVLVLEEEEKQLELVYPQVIICTTQHFCDILPIFWPHWHVTRLDMASQHGIACTQVPHIFIATSCHLGSDAGNCFACRCRARILTMHGQ